MEFFYSKQHPKMVVAVCVFLSVVLQKVHGDAVSWNYNAGDFVGDRIVFRSLLPIDLSCPENWYKDYPDCGGKMQSPINIDTQKVLYDFNLERFNFSEYDKIDGINMTLENVGGHTAEVLYDGSRNKLKITGGSLPDVYVLDQFHFHWGRNSTRGSEHSVNSNFYPMELHLVHHQERLMNVTQAAPHPYGLAVVAFFFMIGKQNPNYDELLSHFDKIANASTKATIPPFPVKKLLPESERYDFFRYAGSLTTPPCSESVIWSVMVEPIEISEAQENRFRGLYDAEFHHLVDDFRPTQELNRRSVLTTHELYKSGATSFVTPQTNSLVLALFGLVLLVLT